MSLFVTRGQGPVLLSTMTYYGGGRCEWRVQWLGLGLGQHIPQAIRDERERLLRRVG